jgi:hypothetical protein
LLSNNKGSNTVNFLGETEDILAEQTVSIHINITKIATITSCLFTSLISLYSHLAIYKVYYFIRLAIPFIRIFELHEGVYEGDVAQRYGEFKKAEEN